MKRLDAIAKRWDDLAPGNNDVEDQYCIDVAHMTDLLREAIRQIRWMAERFEIEQKHDASSKWHDRWARASRKWLAKAEAEE